LEYFFVKIIYEALRPVGRILLKFFILPLYSLLLISRLRINRLALPARGFALFLITNKYLFHFSLMIAASSTIYANLQTQQALAHDAGQHSLLYTIMTNGESEIVQEDLRYSDSYQASVRLPLGTIEAIPAIDFNYSTGDELPPLTSSQIAGTLVLRPLSPDEERSGSSSKPLRTEIEIYTVKAGDSLGTIARDYDIDVGTLLWANNLSARQYIRPGDKLKILPVAGVLVAVKSGDTLSAIAKKYQGNVDDIIKVNQLTDDKVPVGKELVIPGGMPPVIEQNRVVAVSRDQLREPGVTQYTAPAGAANVAKPADAAETGITTKLLWPTSARVITQYYGWRHTGLDIAGDQSNPLYAAEDGVVTISGWNSGGYGYQVMIDHPNGMKTRYAHASKLFVSVGDQVKRGQVIAMMGSTGRSTGPHIHFEVYVNGSRVNPLLYIK
jgi:LysM repeat protein